MATAELTKEEKERIIDEKINNMIKKNALMEQRHKEIENDKRQAMHHSSTVQMQEVKAYVMRSTAYRSNRPRPQVNEGRDGTEIKFNSRFSQRLAEVDFPPPDPYNSFLVDYQRHSEEYQQSSRTEGSQRENGRGEVNYKGSNRARFRSNTKDSLIVEKNGASNRYRVDGNNIDLKRRYSTRSNYTGQGSRMQYNGYSQNANCAQSRDICRDTGSWRRADNERIEDGTPTAHSYNQKEYDLWKAEQDGYDRDRIARSKKGDGQWRREWDSHKADLEQIYPGAVKIPNQYQERNLFRNFLVQKRVESSANNSIQNKNKYYPISYQKYPNREESHSVKPEIKNPFARYLVRRSAEHASNEQNASTTKHDFIRPFLINETQPLKENGSLVTIDDYSIKKHDDSEISSSLSVKCGDDCVTEDVHIINTIDDYSIENYKETEDSEISSTLTIKRGDDSVTVKEYNITADDDSIDDYKETITEDSGISSSLTVKSSDGSVTMDEDITVDYSIETNNENITEYSENNSILSVESGDDCVTKDVDITVDDCVTKDADITVDDYLIENNTENITKDFPINSRYIIKSDDSTTEAVDIITINEAAVLDTVDLINIKENAILGKSTPTILAASADAFLKRVNHSPNTNGSSTNADTDSVESYDSESMDAIITTHEKISASICSLIAKYDDAVKMKSICDLDTPASLIPESDFSASSFSISENSLKEIKVSESSFTPDIVDLNKSSDVFLNKSHYDNNLQELLTFKDTIVSVSETSSIYDPIDDEFQSLSNSDASLSVSDASFVSIPDNTSENTLNKPDDFSDINLDFHKGAEKESSSDNNIFDF